MAAHVSHGAKYIHECIRCVFSMTCKIVLYLLAPVSTLGKGTDVHKTTTLSGEVAMDEQNEHAAILVAKVITIPAKTESAVMLVTSERGFMKIQ